MKAIVAASSQYDQATQIAALQRALRSILRRKTWAHGLSVVAFESNIYTSTFASAVLTCNCADGRLLRVFCKRGRGAAYQTCGHKRGVVYEAAVYRHLLRNSKMSLPHYFGSYRDRDQMTWLFIECIDDAARWSLTLRPDLDAIRLARWLGLFHAEQEKDNRRAHPTWLTRHDATYFLTWVHRTAEFAKPLRRTLPWLNSLCERSTSALEILLDAPRTVIHGELFPQNVLVRNSTILPVDWESASLAAGEEDLASMTDNWSEEVVAACEKQYVESRWPEGAPHTFERTLHAARLFHQFRWLGERKERTVGDSRWRFDHLHRAGQALELI